MGPLRGHPRMYCRHCSFCHAKPHSTSLPLRHCQLGHYDWHYTDRCRIVHTWVCDQRVGVGTSWSCLHCFWYSSLPLPCYRITNYPVGCRHLCHRLWSPLPCPGLPVALMGFVTRGLGLVEARLRSNHMINLWL